jgi:uncharacterized protein
VIALGLYRTAAEQGFPEAEFNVGVMHDVGLGTPEDQATAAAWYRKAAEKGHPHAQFTLGNKYAYGEGVPQDYVMAHLWLNLAAAGYPALEIEARNDAIQRRETVAKLMTPSQLADAHRLAREWKPKVR